jgi:hypothetical protein
MAGQAQGSSSVRSRSGATAGAIRVLPGLYGRPGSVRARLQSPQLELQTNVSPRTEPVDASFRGVMARELGYWWG